MITQDKAILIEATTTDYPVIQNMARFYVYDMTRYCGNIPGWECPDDGLFSCVDLKNYFDDPTCHAFLIKAGAELAGFALINKKGSTPDVDWNMGEFFVLAKFQGSGMGRQIAGHIFNLFHGIWELATIPENTRALSFWHKAIAHFTGGAFSESRKMVQDPEPHPMIIYRFEATTE